MAWPGGMHLLVVADGIGGGPCGDIASATVVDSFREAFVQASDLPIRNRLLAALQASNDNLFHQIAAEPSCTSMGTTLLAVCLVASKAWWVSVGDSPCWLMRDHSIQRLNERHTVGALLDQQAAEGLLSTEEAAAAPDRPQLVEAVLGDDINWVDAPVEPAELCAGDRLLAATDGVETCTEAELIRVAASSRGRPSQAVESILGRIELNARPDQPRQRDGDLGTDRG